MFFGQRFVGVHSVFQWMTWLLSLLGWGGGWGVKGKSDNVSLYDVFCSTAYLGRGMLQFFSSFSLGCVSISFSPERDVLKSYRGDLTDCFICKNSCRKRVGMKNRNVQKWQTYYSPPKLEKGIFTYFLCSQISLSLL